MFSKIYLCATKLKLLFLMLLIFTVPIKSNGYEISKSKDVNEIQLERDVKKLIYDGDIVTIRHQIDKLYQLADVYEKKGLDEKAIGLYKKALEANSGNIPVQMLLANLLKKTGRNDEAMETAYIVFELAEDNKLIIESEKFLLAGGHKIPDFNTNPVVDANVEIVLVPMGDINYRTLHSLREALKERMGINFTISRKTKNIGLVDRVFTSRFINNYYDWLKGIIEPNKFPEIVTELGYTEKGLEDANARNEFIHSFYSALGERGQKEIREYDEQLLNARKTVQYNANRLLSEMHKEFPLGNNTTVKGYMAITDKDIYANESNFLFGNAMTGYGVMSYHRFTSGFNHEEQNRPRLIKRVVKQAISTANFILGIPRCTNPNCVRAYPHSLDEHDQKPDTLCPLCRKRLDDYRKTQANRL